MGIVFDEWQREILDCDENILLCKGRRIGGTEIFSIKAAVEMVKIPGVKIVFVSLTEDQAQICIDVCLSYLMENHRKLIAKGRLKPTLNKIHLTNGSSIIVRPLGSSGMSVRSFTGDIIGIDEAPWQPAMMWRALRPIIVTSKKGRIWMWGTPASKSGYYWEQYHRIHDLGKPGRFKVWHLTTEEVLLNRPICESWTQEQYDNALELLREEKEDMSELEWRNEFMGEFMDEINQLFPDYLLERAMVLERPEVITPGDYYLGVDYATMGGDLIVHSVFQKLDKKFFQRESLAYKYKMPWETNMKILELDSKYHFKGIYIDSGGSGIALADFCQRTPSLRNKTIQIDNATRSITQDDKRKKKLLKEDLYMNALSMLDHEEVQLLKDPDIAISFKSVVMEVDERNRNIYIHAKHNHHVESIIRSLWANHNTRLALWVR